MSDVVIRASGLGKKYLIGHALKRQRYTALRDVIAATFGKLWRRTMDTLHGGALVVGDTIEEFWALDGLDFEIKRGEVVGIVGRNGAGKTTLLKILSRITEPTIGRVEICGRVASLLEVGTGFHPELTGRENIYLNGAILGMTRAEIRRKFDEIVDFAGIEKFIDTPVKRYSSGMYVRLAFAVAAHLEPEILIVDEVLAVGDAEFQRKCLGKMQDVAGHGRTVLFVSHNMAAVEQLCSRAILLDGGRIALEGATRSVVTAYLANLEQEVLEFIPESDPRRVAEITRVALCDQAGMPLALITSADTPNVKIELNVRERKRDLKIAFILHDARQDVIFSSCPPDDGVEYPTQPGRYEFQAAFPAALLMAQRYSITISVYSGAGEHIHVCWHALVFDVSPAATRLQAAEPNRMGVLQIECRWRRKNMQEEQTAVAESA